MSVNRYKITNITHSGVSIGDMGVHLNGRGSTCIVSAQALHSSQNLKYIKKMVKIEPIMEQAMPFFPFGKSNQPEMEDKISDKTPQPDSNVESSKAESAVLVEIRDLLKVLVSQSSSINQLSVPNPNPNHNPNIDISSTPQFIPSNIVPVVDVNVSVKPKIEETEKLGFDDSIASLRAMRRK